ncbi:MAG: hypothetical protein K1X55_17200, partial [Chitinophagales bacterium]|nr:hypothetical protein [Chitinophagales bacterium]
MKRNPIITILRLALVVSIFLFSKTVAFGQDNSLVELTVEVEVLGHDNNFENVYGFYNCFLRINGHTLNFNNLPCSQKYTTSVKYCKSGNDDFVMGCEGVFRKNAGNKGLCDTKDNNYRRIFKAFNNVNSLDNKIFSHQEYFVNKSDDSKDVIFKMSFYQKSKSCPNIDIPATVSLCSKDIGTVVSDVSQHVSPRILTIANANEFTDYNWYLWDEATEQYDLINLPPPYPNYVVGGNLDLDKYALTQSLPARSQQYKFKVEAHTSTPLSISPGCWFEKEVFVTIQQSPEVFDAMGGELVQQLCTGTALAISGPDAPEGENYSYSWNNGKSCSQTLSINTPGNYNLTVKDHQGCTVSQTVRVDAASAKPITLSNGLNLCVDGSNPLTLSVSNTGDYASYLWSNGSTASSIGSIEDPGMYTVTATASNGCSAFFEAAVVPCSQTVWDGRGGEICPGMNLPKSLMDAATISTPAEQTVSDPRSNYNMTTPPAYIGFVHLKYVDDIPTESVKKNWFYHINYDVYDNGVYKESGELIIDRAETSGVFEAVNKYNLSTTNGKNFKIAVTDVTASVNGTSPATSLPPDNIYVELELKVLYRPVLSQSATVQNVLTIADAVNAKTEFLWDNLDGAIEYEVQLAYHDALSLPLAVADRASFMDEQGWTFTVSEPEFVLDMTFPAGELLYRIRPIGIFTQQDLSRIPEKHICTWTEPAIINLPGNTVFAGGYFEPSRNWQKVATFAEEGKKKEVVTYFDNMMRPIQVQTNLNTDNTTLVAESYFDSEGRSVFGVLPVPMLKQNLLFEASINKINTGSGDIAIEREHFERDNQLPLSTVSGAGQYYSAGNPFKSNAALAALYPNLDLIPDATTQQSGNPSGAYVTTLVQYERSGSGRIETQSGVGEMFRIGPDVSNPTADYHPTRYFYGQATQTELERLFGLSVWDSRLYQKNAVVDGNGQISLAYIDVNGRTVATALTGVSPDNVHELDRPQPDDLYNILDNDINSHQKAMVSEYSTTIANDASKVYQFEYSLEGMVSDIAAQSVGNITIDAHCKTCVYELELYILDPKGEKIPLTQSGVSNNGPYLVDMPVYGTDKLDLTGLTANTSLLSSNQNSIIHTFDNDDINGDGSCPRPVDYHEGIAFNVVLDKIGKYTLVRQLRITSGGADAYGEWLKDSEIDITTINTPDHDCQIALNCDCDACKVEAYYATEDYHNSQTILNAEFNPGFDLCDPDTWNELEKEFYEDFYTEHCTAAGQVEAMVDEEMMEQQCNAILQKLMSDVSPEGFWYESNFDHILDNFKAYYDVAGSNPGNDHAEWTDFDVHLQSGDKAQIQDNWQAGYAAILAPFHPEYCHYQACVEESYLASKVFDVQMKTVNTWSEAQTKGFIDANGQVLGDPVENILNCSGFAVEMNNNFPIRDDVGNIIYDGKGLDKLLDPNYAASNYSGTYSGKNISDIVTHIREGLYIDANDFTPPRSLNTAETAENERRRWQYFTAMYQSEKLRWIEQHFEQVVNSDFDIKEACPFYHKDKDKFTGLGWTVEAPPVTSVPADYTPVCSFSGSATYGVEEQDVTETLQNMCPGVARGTLGRITSACGVNFDELIETFNTAVAPPNGFPIAVPFDRNDDDYIFACNSLFPQTLSAIEAYCDAAIGIYNPFGWLTPEIIQSYLDESLFSSDPILYERVEDVFYALKADVLSWGAAVSQQDKDDLISCLYDKLDEGMGYACGGASLPTLAPVCMESGLPDIEGTGDNTPVPLLPELDNIDYTVTECQVSCLQGIVGLIKDYSINPNEENVNTANISSCVSGSGNQFDHVQWQGSYDLTGVEAANGVYVDGFMMYMGNGSNDPCPNCHVSFFFLDAAGNRIKNITALTYKGVVATDPFAGSIPTPVMGDDYHITPVFGHLSYEATYYNGSGTITTSVVYMYGMGYNYLGRCGEEVFGNCTEKTIPHCIDYNIGTIDPIEPCADAMEAYYELIDNILNDEDEQAAIAAVASMHANTCLGYQEHLRYNTIDYQHHYTLYYYDRAGNLAQTVPPAGVYPLTSTSSVTDPEHVLQTQYKYNSRNQIVWQSTPDGGVTHFWYNDKGQLILSQNAKQAAATNPEFSFTKYDGLSRIELVGEVTDILTTYQAGNSTKTIQDLVNDKEWLADISNYSGQLEQITKTFYDKPIFIAGIVQEHLLNRVSATYYFENYTALTQNDGRGSVYSYDELGNVKTLLQDIQTTQYQTVTPDNKRIDYEYDLVSGKVNKVKYQRGKDDQFTHRYEYDADNRLTDVYTTRDGIVEYHDAKYHYYPHGPLARIELGDNQVQGQDYYYTLQGWLKGVNDPGTN